MCFFAHDPSRLIVMAHPAMVDSRTIVIAYQDCEEPVITAPASDPNAILSFGGKRTPWSTCSDVRNSTNLVHLGRG